MPCCCAIPLVMGSQASLTFLKHLLFVSCAICRIYTCVEQGGMRKVGLHPLVRDEVVWINF